MHRLLSQKFKFFTFLSIALLVLVHGYNLQQTYLTPFSLVHERLTVTTFLEYFLANGFLRFRIPMLFLISGYIFSIQDQRSYAERIKRRSMSLLVPYFIWSALGLAFTFLLQQNDLMAEIVARSNIDQLGDNRPYSEIGWSGVLYRWIWAPPSFQLWFIRSLFVYNLMYPVFRWMVLKWAVPGFLLLFLLWITMLQLPLLEGQGMFFFALGIWLNKRSYPMDKKPEWYSHYVSWLLFSGACVIKTFIAFEFDSLNPASAMILSLLHVLAAIAGVLAVWYSFDGIVQWFMNKKWFEWISSFSFFIYGFHIPMLAYTTTLFFGYGQHFRLYRLTTYFLASLSVLLICIAIGALTRKAFPRAYKLMTGGRGF